MSNQNNQNTLTDEHWQSAFENIAKATRSYMDTQTNREKLLDLELDVKKAKLAEKKVDDKEFRREIAKDIHPHNFIARWAYRISTRIRQHNIRAESLDKFKEKQKEERAEIKSNLQAAMDKQVQLKEEYVKAYKAGDRSWFESAKTNVETINEGTRAARAENIERFDIIKDKVETHKREEAERIARNATRDLTREEIESEYYENYTPPEPSKEREIVPERRQLDLTIAQLEGRIKPQQQRSAPQRARVEPTREEITQDDPAL